MNLSATFHIYDLIISICSISFHIHFWFAECSTTESSDDIEKQEMEEVSDDDEISYYDTREDFTETGFGFGSAGALDQVNKSGEANTQCIDMEDIHVENSMCNYGYPQIARRGKLPDPIEKEKGVSLWSMIKDNVGKDLTRVCLPVYFNEPISSLQKCFEDLEYSYLLDRAYEYGKSVRYTSCYCAILLYFKQFKFSNWFWYMIYIVHLLNEFSFSLSVVSMYLLTIVLQLALIFNHLFG